LRLLTIFATFFVLSGDVDALGGLSLVSFQVREVLSGITFIGGGIALFALIWTSLRPGALSQQEEATLARLPDGFYSLAFAPLEPQSPEPAGSH
ncbi:MAG: hypothetical protein L3J91_05230, partial [Thermoplasmata archaeon]|nr:hypothetical protein [Thermoplasmata archaeon]